jgi:hypothetical protein
LKGETERAAGELAEARRLSRDGRYSSIARPEALRPSAKEAQKAIWPAPLIALGLITKLTSVLPAKASPVWITVWGATPTAPTRSASKGGPFTGPASNATIPLLLIAAFPNANPEFVVMVPTVVPSLVKTPFSRTDASVWHASRRATHRDRRA